MANCCVGVLAFEDSFEENPITARLAKLLRGLPHLGTPGLSDAAIPLSKPHNPILERELRPSRIRSSSGKSGVIALATQNSISHQQLDT
jgi:hypothetical protein